MKKNRVAACLLAALLLAGCSLATQDEGEAAGQFVGLRLRLWDINSEEEWAADETAFELDGNGRLVEKPAENRTEYTLDDGDQFVVLETVQTETGAPSVGFRFSDAMADAHQSVNVTDAGTDYAAECRVHFSSDIMRNSGTHILFFDSIYQRPDGTLYCQRESGGISGHIGGFSHSVSTSRSQTGADGKTTAETLTVKVDSEVCPRLESVCLIEMDESDRPVARHAVDLSEKQDTIYVSDAAAYVLVREEAVDDSEDGQGRTVTTYSALNLSEGGAFHTIYVPRDDGWTIPVTLRIEQKG